MPGSLFDLEQPTLKLPARIVVDSSLIVPRLSAAQSTLTPITAAHARRFFRLLRETPSVGLVPPTVFGEVVHFTLKTHFQDLLPAYRSELRERRPRKRGADWLDLYKLRPDLIGQLRPELERLPSLLRANGLAILQPLDLAPLPLGRFWEGELTRLVVRYHLDTNDTAILLEAQRAGITSIATLDADLRRSARDFDVYTWL
ncbi:MAG: hypothetical protein ACRDJH_26475 [Thermomicrobiales bacterium]